MENSFAEKIKNSLAKVKDVALIPPPSNEANIVRCNAKLQKADFPELPTDYTQFLLIMNGFSLNSVSFFGDARVYFPDENVILENIISKNDTFKKLYGEKFKNRLWVGRNNNNLCIYNPETKKYETRDHECIDNVLGECDTFFELFENNVR